ncbi:MAG TPA: alpha/beta hydrolase [Gemmatimonadaceae bacterium]|nr:alpha/beta hydrolase [Gemmatimonadaceae bacterium]
MTRIPAFLLSAIVLTVTVARSAEAQDSGWSRAEARALLKTDTLLTFLRQRNAGYYAITTPNGIDDRRYVTLGGMPQWVTIRGENKNNPVILFVHGGPGDAMSLFGYAVFRAWEKYFTLVQWDQRGAGLTYERSGPSVAPTVTIDRIVADGLELADTLRRELHKDKIILIGHSFGSMIGVLMVKAKPALFSAYVGTGQVGAPSATTQAVAYRQLLAAARKRDEGVALRELEDIGPPPFKDARGWQIAHKWANLFEHADAFLNASLMFEMTAPGYTLADLDAKIDGEGFSGEQLVPQINAFDVSRLRGWFGTPVFVFQGVEDYTTPDTLAHAWLNAIHAPRKAFVRIAGGGHFVMFTEPDAFLDELRRRVAPSIRGQRQGARPDQ